MAARKGASIRAPRLSREARREQILDSAVSLIIARGLSSCTLEVVAVEAGISKPLIHLYFSKREDLLKAILEREFRFLGGHQLQAKPRNAPLDQVVLTSIKGVLNYLYERGPILGMMMNDRSVASLVKDHGANERSAVAKYFVKRCQKAYGVSEEIAFVCTILIMNAPLLSAQVFKKRGIAVDRVAQIWNCFLIGGWKEIRAQFVNRRTTTSNNKADSPSR